MKKYVIKLILGGLKLMRFSKKIMGVLLSASFVLSSGLGSVVSASNIKQQFDYSLINSVESLEKHMENGVQIGNYNYIGKIDEVYNNDKAVKYEVEENDVKYNMVYDKEKNTYIINEREYSFDEFIDASMEQYNNFFKKSAHIDNSLLSVIQGYESNENKINYDKLNYDYENEIKNHEHNTDKNSRCTSCSIGSTVPPKSGYLTKEYNTGTKNRKLLIATTTAAIAALATWATWGTISVAKGVMSTFIGAFGGNVVGMYTYMEYTGYQSFHKTCPKAVKERRKIWANNPNGPGGTYTNKYNYFYSSRP